MNSVAILNQKKKRSYAHPHHGDSKAKTDRGINAVMSHEIWLRLGFRRNFCLYLHTNLVSSPIKGILEILNLTPGAFRWIFWHGRIVSDQVQVRFHI